MFPISLETQVSGSIEDILAALWGRAGCSHRGPANKERWVAFEKLMGEKEKEKCFPFYV